MTRKFCIVEDDGPIRTVTLNRPEVLNALNDDAHEELAEVWDEFAASDNLWVGIITGAGDRSFCAGNDLKGQASGKRRPHPRSGFAGLTARFDLDKPIIGAANGLAYGGGFEILLSVDIIVAAEHVKFALPEARVGLMAGAGGVHRLPRMMPQKKAFEMMLTGAPISAAEAASYGIVNAVTPKGELMQAARHFAEAILECSPLAVRAAKQSALQGLDAATLEEAMHGVYPAQERNRASQDYLEGPRAFAEKRKPVWQNR